MQFDCPICQGAFDAPEELLGGEVTCPHCSQVVALPAPPPSANPVASPPEAERPQAPASTKNEPAQPEPPPPPKKLTAEQRAAARRRFNLALAVTGALLLIVIFVVLTQVGG